MVRIILASTLAATAVAAAAAGPLTVNSSVSVETKQRQADGTTRVVLAPARKVLPGDRVVLTLSYHNTGSQPIADIAFDNPVPAGLAYRAPVDGSPAPEVSVDGKTFGTLPDLTAKDAAGVRPARPDDVKRIRWRLVRPLPAGGQGQLAYAAVVK